MSPLILLRLLNGEARAALRGGIDKSSSSFTAWLHSLRCAPERVTCFMSHVNQRSA